MNHRLLIAPALGAIAALTLAGCSASPTGDSSAGGSRIAVVASTDVWGSMASSVGGDQVTVTSIIDDPSKDPHEYQADAQTQLKLSKAKVVIENGGGYDDFVDTMLKSSSNSSVVKLNAVEKVIDQVQATYSKLDAANSSAFQKNAAALKSKVKVLEAKEADVKAQHQDEGVSITEPVPLYMLEAMGLDNKTPDKFSEAVEEDTDVAPSVLQETLALYSSHTVKLLAYNEQTTGPQTEAVLKAAKDNSIPTVPVRETLPAGKDYVEWMSANVNAISAALSKR